MLTEFLLREFPATAESREKRFRASKNRRTDSTSVVRQLADVGVRLNRDVHLQHSLSRVIVRRGRARQAHLNGTCI